MAGDESVCDWSDSMGGSVTGDGGSRLGCNRRRIARLNWKRIKNLFYGNIYIYELDGIKKPFSCQIFF